MLNGALENDFMQAKFKQSLLTKYPELKGRRLVYLAEGWDNIAGLLGNEWIFLFPKRIDVELQLQVGQRLLRLLARQLPLPIPQFQFFSDKPGATFAGYRRLAGQPLAEIELLTDQASWWQAQTGKFLSRLHAFSVEQARDLGVKSMSWDQEQLPAAAGWREALFNFYDTLKAQVFPFLDVELQRWGVEHFVSFLRNEANFIFEPALLHGDFSKEHILVDPVARCVTGIIDWGDIAIGDPAYDLLEELVPFYSGAVDSDFIRRLRFYKDLEPFICLRFGLQHQDLALIDYGLYQLNQKSAG